MSEIPEKAKKLKEIIDSGFALEIFDIGADGVPIYMIPVAKKELIKTIDKISGIYDENGNVKDYSFAETYAISLYFANNCKEAKEIFEAITANGLEELTAARVDPAIPEIGVDEDIHYFNPVENVFGKLGFEGLYKYACACYKAGENEKAKELFIKIKDIPLICQPKRLAIIRLKCLNQLARIYNLSLEDEIEQAKQYAFGD